MPFIVTGVHQNCIGSPATGDCCGSSPKRGTISGPRRRPWELQQSKISSTLTDALVEADAGGDGDVEARDFAGHGDAGEEVALFAGEASHAGAFCSHHHADGAFEVDFV